MQATTLGTKGQTTSSSSSLPLSNDLLRTMGMIVLMMNQVVGMRSETIVAEEKSVFVLDTFTTVLLILLSMSFVAGCIVGWKCAGLRGRRPVMRDAAVQAAEEPWVRRRDGEAPAVPPAPVARARADRRAVHPEQVLLSSGGRGVCYHLEQACAGLHLASGTTTYRRCRVCTTGEP